MHIYLIFCRFSAWPIRLATRLPGYNWCTGVQQVGALRDAGIFGGCCFLRIAINFMLQSE